jgi:hypothetical protein
MASLFSWPFLCREWFREATHTVSRQGSDGANTPASKVAFPLDHVT